MSARLLPDGSCELIDLADRATKWPTAVAWARSWLTEWHSGEHGPACEFIRTLTDDAPAGVVAVLVELTAQAAPDSEDLAWVGAGPLEDLLSHSGNGAAVLDEVEQAARRHPTFRSALSNVWVGSDVPSQVRSRLSALGARDLSADR